MIFGTLAGIDISSGLGVGIVVAAFVGGAVLFVIVRAIIDKARQATLATELSAIRIAADAEAQKICAQADGESGCKRRPNALWPSRKKPLPIRIGILTT